MLLCLSQPRNRRMNAQYPALHLRHRALGRRQVGLQERRKATVPVGARQPGGDAEGVVLIAGAALVGEAAAPQGRIDLGDGRASGRNVPAVERPEMHARPKPLADEAQPRNPGVGGFRDRSLHIEMKHRLRAAGAFLGQPPPAGIAHARRAIAVDAVADEIDIGVVLVGRPVALEIVEERRPVGLQAMHLEIAQREREAVVDADQRRRVFGEPLDQPFGDALPRPVFARDGGGGTSTGGASPSAR